MGDDRQRSRLSSDFSESDESGTRQPSFDSVTGLPTAARFAGECESLLSRHEELGIIYVNMVDLVPVERLYGAASFDRLMWLVAQMLERYRTEDLEAFPESALVVSGNAFVILIAPPEDGHVDKPLMQNLVASAERALDAFLKDNLEQRLYRNLSVYIGWSVLPRDDDVRFERLYNDSLDDALKRAHLLEEQDENRRFDELVEIIIKGRISTVFQPIVDLRTGKPFGYEAFTRGPAGDLELPGELFKTAYEADMVWQLDHVCRTKTLENARGMPPSHILFMNIEPETVHDPAFDRLMAGEDHLPLDQTNIVFEVTERCAIADYDLFRASMQKFRSLGFKVAIDDVGVGFGSLHSIAELRPDYIKVDISLVRGCQDDEFRQGLIETMAGFARRTGVKLIAEGIESEGEVETLKDLGVKYGQGFYFARPMPSFLAV